MRQMYLLKSAGILMLAGMLVLFGYASVMAMESSMAEQDQMIMSKIQQTDARLSIGPMALSQIQKVLAEKGFAPGPADGVWGAKTASAIKNFQITQNLLPTGMLDIETIQSLGLSDILTGGMDDLNSRDLEKKCLGKGALLFLSPYGVRNLQQSLQDKGIAAGPVDGILGGKTKMAVMAFQNQNNIKPTNNITLLALNRLGMNQVTANLGFEDEGESLSYSGALAAAKLSTDSQQSMAARQELRGYFPESVSETNIGAAAPLFADNSFVKQIQEALVNKGYYPGPVDGKWGQYTSYAVGIYQLDNNLPYTAYLTLATINKLLQ